MLSRWYCMVEQKENLSFLWLNDSKVSVQWLNRQKHSSENSRVQGLV